MAFTVQQLARIAGISPRTLRYYDRIGLLKPSQVRPNGYRAYSGRELTRLQQILFFRELKFSLEHIKKMLSSPDFKTIEVLLDQQKLLTMERDRLDQLLHYLDNTITTMKNPKKLIGFERLGSFARKEMEKYKDEARQKWGHTKAYKQSMKRIRQEKETMKKEGWDLDRISQETLEIAQELAGAMSKKIESDEVQQLVERHYRNINQYYECDLKLYRCLGRMYVEDKRFTAYYDKFKPGLADFVHRAIEYYCDQRIDENITGVAS